MFGNRPFTRSGMSILLAPRASPHYGGVGEKKIIDTRLPHRPCYAAGADSIGGNAMKHAADYAAAALTMLMSRRKMDQFFPGLFADPARDMLLDLFVAAEEGRELSVT